MSTNPPTAEERELMRRWVETWKRAGEELEAIRRRELQEVDTCEAVQRIFGSIDVWSELPARTTSGLVEQQAWFRKLRP